LVLQRMLIENLTPQPDQIILLAEAYSHLGSVREIMELISEFIDARNLPLTAPLVASAIRACTKKIDSVDLHFVKELWEKYKTEIFLDWSSAVTLAHGFGLLSDTFCLMEVYYKAKRELDFKTGDPTDLCRTVIIYAPSDKETQIVVNDYKDAKESISEEIYCALFQNYQIRGDVKNSILLIKEYITDTFESEYSRSIFLEFFVNLARNDYGHYRRDAEAWLNRLYSKSTIMQNLFGHFRPLKQPLTEDTPSGFFFSFTSHSIKTIYSITGSL